MGLKSTLLVLIASLLWHSPQAIAASCAARHGVGINSGVVRDTEYLHSETGEPCIYWSGANVDQLEKTGAKKQIFTYLHILCVEHNAKIEIFSGYRAPKHNDCVDGAKYSQHLAGTAVDFYIRGVNPHQVAKTMARFNGGKGYYPKSRSFHLDARRKDTCWRGMKQFCRQNKENMIAAAEDMLAAEKRRMRQEAAGPRSIIEPPGYAPPPPSADPQDSIDLYEKIMGQSQPPISDDDVHDVSTSYFGAGIPLLLGGAAVGLGALALSGSGGDGDSGSSSVNANNTNNITSQNFNKAIATVPTPDVCLKARTALADSCDDNYKLRSMATQCLFRVREAEKIAARTLRERKVQFNAQNDASSFQDSSQDYQIAEAVSVRQINLIEKSLMEMRTYRSSMIIPEDTSFAEAVEEDCYGQVLKDIVKSTREMEAMLSQARATAQANGFHAGSAGNRIPAMTGAASTNPNAQVQTPAEAAVVEEAVDDYTEQLEGIGQGPAADHVPFDADPMVNEL